MTCGYPLKMRIVLLTACRLRFEAQWSYADLRYCGITPEYQLGPSPFVGSCEVPNVFCGFFDERLVTERVIFNPAVKSHDDLVRTCFSEADR